MKTDSVPLTLVVGDKNLSTWSMRPWLVMQASGLKFKEIVVLLDRPDSKQKIRKYSSSGKVPVLLHGKTKIWDSLAICEYLAELAPNKSLWPKDRLRRAQARSYVAEMHSGFAAMRAQLSMNIQSKSKITHLLPDAVADIERVLEMWKSALKQFGGPFLFGDYGIADAYYTPVVFRFVNYGINIRDASIKKYIDRVLKQPNTKLWVAGAKRETPLYLKF